MGLMLAGCGSGAASSVSTQTVALNPAAAQTSPDRQALQVVGILDGGAGSFHTVLDQSGDRLSGSGLLSRGDDDMPVEASGHVKDGKISLRLFPDDAASGTDIFSARGDLGGSGVWFDTAARTSGSLTLQQLNGASGTPRLAGRFLDGQPSEGPRAESFNIVCQASIPGEFRRYTFQIDLKTFTHPFYEGEFTCDRPVGEFAGYGKTSGTSAAIRFSPLRDGRGAISLRVQPYSARAGFFVFKLPEDRVGASAALDSDSIVPDGEDLRVTGTITVVDRGSLNN